MPERHGPPASRPSDEWNPRTGLLRAFRRLAVRSGVALVLWAATLWLAAPILNFLTLHPATLILFCVVMIAPGVAIGHGLSRKLTEIAGMVSIPLSAMAVAFGWAVAVLGVVLADMLRPLGDWQCGFAWLTTGFWISLWLVKTTWIET